ncbi:GntR family transcriptional regulator [Arthrobacter sp. Soil736]|uniref:GntR family transcriptional regulator n=1 Tax=Arthrobacter sp. Soil736 TaxID=1736395 RepID=UPI0006F7104E|nr:GntR family transcriptional regulator [Arthrobacter sp. Soil736]KRE59399.1 GntR family transcriptional regulator [Arthrobacter sp. Soil736]
MANRREPGTTYADTVYNLLLKQFMAGEREAGQSLNIPSIAREFDVSQTPVREALARLEHTGLVTREPLKGYRVAPMFSEHELVKLMEARLVIEPAVTLEAARRVTPEFLAELQVTVDELAAAAESESFSEHWRTDDAFHGLISKQSGNPFLDSAYLAIGGHVRRFRLLAKASSRTAAIAVIEHGHIIEALEARDAEKAAEAMRQHIEGAAARALADRKSIG